ncbi:hypothetical protein LINGRAHAP2_LOCUS12728 [Linum grandiflorum]
MISPAMAIEGGKESRVHPNLQILKDFMTRVAKLEELGASASRFLSDFHQSLVFLRRPPLDIESKLISKIISANDTKRMKSYVGSGCCNGFDRVQYTSQCKMMICSILFYFFDAEVRSCHLGLLEHITKAKSLLNELEQLMEDMSVGIRDSDRELTSFQVEDLCEQLEQQDLSQEQGVQEREEAVLLIASSLGVVYSMLKQDYVMQEKIVESLSLKSTAEELGSYTMMWSLRPYVDDDIMQQAWGLIN